MYAEFLPFAVIDGEPQYYSVNIYNDDISINTWKDWCLIPTERPSIAPPEVKTEYVDIPGANGSLDYTEVLAGEVRYGNRTGSWEFIVDDTNSGKWYSLYDDIRTLIHGKKFNCTLQEQPNYVYTGRLSVGQWKTGEQYSTITIEYNFEPFKIVKEGTIEDWLWDDLTFDNNIYTIYYGRFAVSGSLLRNFFNSLNKTVEVSLTLSDSMSVALGQIVHDDYYGDQFIPMPGYPITLSSGTTEHTGIMLAPATSDLEGNNILLFTGNGSVTVSYERGADNI